MRTIKIEPILPAFLLIVLPLSAQENDPLEFFPHKTGNMWEYLEDLGPYYPPDTLQVFVVQDSTGIDGKIYAALKSRYISPPYYESCMQYIIDSLNRVWTPYSQGDSSGLALVYKLDAKQGEKWTRWARRSSYEMVKVDSVWVDELFGIPTIVKRFIYYIAPSDTSDWICEQCLHINSHELAYGFGESWWGG